MKRSIDRQVFALDLANLPSVHRDNDCREYESEGYGGADENAGLSKAVHGTEEHEEAEGADEAEEYSTEYRVICEPDRSFHLGLHGQSIALGKAAGHGAAQFGLWRGRVRLRPPQA